MADLYQRPSFRISRVADFAGVHLRKPQELLQAQIAFCGSEVGAGVLIDALRPDSAVRRVVPHPQGRALAHDVRVKPRVVSLR